MRKNLSQADLDLLQEMADEAHNEATSWLFEKSEELRVLREKNPDLMMEEMLHGPTELREILVRLSWLGKVFKFMSLVDELRK